MLSLIKFLVLACLYTQAKSLGSHVHGVANLDIATDQKTLLIIINAPADTFLGFEHKPKSKEDLKAESKSKSLWKKNILSVMGGETLANCKLTKMKWNQKFSGKNHSSINIESQIKCRTSLQGKQLKISFIKNYPIIKEVSLQVLREDGSVIKRKHNEKIFTLRV